MGPGFGALPTPAIYPPYPVSCFVLPVLYLYNAAVLIQYRCRYNAPFPSK